MTARTAVTWAEDHLFDRRSVVREHELWRHALEHARGQDVSLAEIKAVTKDRDYLRDEQFPLAGSQRGKFFNREWEIVRLAQDRMRNTNRFAASYQPSIPFAG